MSIFPSQVVLLGWIVVASLGPFPGCTLAQNPEYHPGEWDISAKEMATLCAAASKPSPSTENLTKLNPDGKQIVVGSSSNATPDRSTYLRDDESCWKNEWVHCHEDDEEEETEDRLGSEGVLAKRRHPCGYYRMVAAPKAECA